MPAARQHKPSTRSRPVELGLADRRREQILDRAIQEFARCGYSAADLQILADKLNVGKGTLYRYFPSKEALFFAAVDRVMILLNERMKQSWAQSDDPLEIIAWAITEYLTFFDRRPEFVELLIQERAVFRDRKQPTYFRHRKKNIAPWQELYRKLIQAGRVRSLAPDAITDVISSALYGTMFTNFFSGRKKSLKVQAKQIIEIVYRGILTDQERHKTKSR
ncbi:MAG: putative HTH-type transcriptional regulator YxaF [Phycisphaerae bacterium]|nr:putative HTH-type transcriptional regulator YxaF [Phycisphaerae bacterium]